MRPLQALRGFILPGLTPKAQWWIGAAALASLLVVAGAVWAMFEQYAVTAVYIGWAAWVMLGRGRERRRFREGWHAGFAEGVLSHLGRTVPDGALRQMASGDPAAEPWDGETRVELTVHEHGPHCRPPDDAADGGG